MGERVSGAKGEWRKGVGGGGETERERVSVGRKSGESQRVERAGEWRERGRKERA